MHRCPTGHSDQVITNGSISTGKPKYVCKAGGRQFVDDPHGRVMSDATQARIDRVLLERISRAGIARAV